VDNLPVAAYFDSARLGKYRIYFGGEIFIATHQVDKSLRIMKNRPGPMPGIAFRVWPTPIHRVEGLYPVAFGVFSTHKAGFRVEQGFCSYTSALQKHSHNIYCRLLLPSW
jgi:hypothetical protein